MAVFTEVTHEQVSVLLAGLDAGALLGLQGISSGIENTNYFVSSSQGEWVLTLFERLTAQQLPYYLGLMQHFARKGLPVPEPRADAQGCLLHKVAGKPAALVQRLAGKHQLAPDLRHCGQLGRVLAQMHLAAADFALSQPNLRGADWRAQMAPQLLPYLGADQHDLLSSEMTYQAQVTASQAYAALPRGEVHADLFCDNVLFDGRPGHERLTGVFDFYFAGNDTLAYDLAVCLNDWCLQADSATLDEPRAQALVNAYEAIRPMSAAEHRLLPALLRAAALRFWLSRLGDWHLPRPARLLQPKDPGHFERVLRARIASPWHAQAN